MVQGTTGPHLLPGKRSREAPKKFKGHYYHVQDFIRLYEQVLADCQITSEEEKCKGITNYCSTKVFRLIESLDEYRDHDWEALKKQILNLYDADWDGAHYHKRDIEKLKEAFSMKTLDNLAAWKYYIREFMVVAQGLKNDKVIQEKDVNTYFWLGIPLDMRKTLDTHLLAGSPTRDVSEPYMMEEITTTIERLLHRYRFNWKACSTTHCGTELAPESDAEPNDSDLDSSDESDYDTRYWKKSRGSRKTSSHSPTREYSGKSARKHKEEKKPRKTSSTDIDRLIDDMNRLT